MSKEELRRLGRYLVHREIGAGGMASVHLGKLAGPAGFSRTVAIKRLHPDLARDPKFVAMFLDEARIAARIRHPNVVATIDVVSQKGELFLVMDYVDGAPLSSLVSAAAKRGERVPIGVAVSLVAGALAGLHAAHECVGESRKPLHVIHRDVSPQNILAGVDGAARVADFGIAKAVGRLQSTTGATMKGKLSYVAPEVVRGEPLDRRVDVFGAAIVLWEILAGQRLFTGNEATILCAIIERDVEPPSAHRGEVPPALDAVVRGGLARDREERFATAEQMANALAASHAPASPKEVGAWVSRLAQIELERRAKLIDELEASVDPPPLSASRRGGAKASGVTQDSTTIADTDAITKRR